MAHHVRPADPVARVHADPMFQRWQPFQQRRDLPAAVSPFAAKLVAGRGDQHLRFNLSETFQNRGRPHVRRAKRPRRPDRRASEEGYDRLRRVGQVAHDPIAGLDPDPLKRRSKRTNLTGQISPAKITSRAVLGLVADCDLPGLRRFRVPQNLRREVERCAGKPYCARHGFFCEAGVGRVSEADTMPFRKMHPKRAWIAYRPVPERVIIRKTPPELMARPLHERSDPAIGGEGGRRGPGRIGTVLHRKNLGVAQRFEELIARPLRHKPDFEPCVSCKPASLRRIGLCADLGDCLTLNKRISPGE